THRCLPSLPTRRSSDLIRMPDLDAGGGAGIGGMATSMKALIAAAVGAAAALGPLLGILTTLPGILAGATAGIATLFVALKGTSEAFGAALSGDIEAMNAALDGLAPSAQQVARDLSTLSGPL